uniref:Uncharacterized protein n=1 Tax=Timema poppense TaxID=170557 RepID=A0A7R9DI07_TIMPO|nr:unnamed protein product [Timema poppensis]
MVASIVTAQSPDLGFILSELIREGSETRNASFRELHVSHSSLMSSDRMKPRSGGWAVTIEATITSLSNGSNEDKEADVELKIAAIHCLCGYICESQARDWFLNLGGVNKIVQCLMNTSVPLRQAAATFLQLAAQEPPIAAAFIHAGMLHWMLDQKTMRRAIPIWETAIETLFSNYLPAKFAYMGRLDMTDVTEEGFYVTRHAERIFPILEELLVARLCPLRPIYVCNFKSTTPALHPSVGMGAKPVRRRARSSSINGSKRPSTNLKMSEVNSTNVNTTQEEFDSLMTASAFDPYLGKYLEQLQSILTTNGTLSYASPSVSRFVYERGSYYLVVWYAPPYFIRMDPSTRKKPGATADGFEKLPDQIMQQSVDMKSMTDRIKVVAQFVAAQMSGPDPHRKCDIHQLELHLSEIKVRQLIGAIKNFS